MHDPRTPSGTYAEHAARGELAFQACGECGAAVFFPRRLCPTCWSTDLEWRASSGDGVVYAATTLYPRDGDAYTIALVELVEGFRIMCTLEGTPHDDVRVVGNPVHVCADASALTAVPAGD